ncbi:AAA family ATPase [Photobacterium leiognathi]|uniref:AAA family ATPase n=1 Tax=Photobacterium leiognathi TaxID=553611 RepID=UPI00273295AD|nr:AAA family ATPase [Photobacterium leiognathi]
MKILKFEAYSIYGFIDVDISFNDDLTLLTGVNGSGKTTSLNLISYMLSANIKELLNISFTYLSLVIEHQKEEYHISYKREKEALTISINGLNETLVIPFFYKDNVNFIISKNGNSDYFESIKLKYREHPIMERLLSFPSITFLGLERRIESVEKGNSYYSEREVMLRQKTIENKDRSLLRDSLGMSLMETELRLQEIYKRMRHFEDRQTIKLRNSILFSAFKYTSFNPEKFESENWKNSAHLLNRKNEIMEALSKIDVLDKKMINEINHFFDRLDSLFVSLDNKEGGLNIEWLTNQAQIERISELVDIIDDHKSKLDKHFYPINKFLEKINLFINDTNKNIIIDAVGQLVVVRPDGSKCTIEGLSSGERQILIIIAHAILNQSSNKDSVFIIDEPELSLHMKWQEMFIDIVKGISPRTQFIMATHSPDIVGDYKNKCKGIR